jgi:hypothetical protein
MGIAASPGIDARRAIRLVEFNVQILRFAHRSWYEDILSDQWFAHTWFDERGRVAARVEPEVSQWLLQELGLQAQMDWQMEEPRKRLWLLDRAALERLALELALSMHREWIVQIIDSVRLRALEAKVTAEALRFVVEELPGGCFQYQSPVVGLDADLSLVDIDAQLKEQGTRTLMALLEPAWAAVRGRAQLFFDRGLKLDRVPPLEPALCERALDLLYGRLLPRRFPEWAWCF